MTRPALTLEDLSVGQTFTTASHTITAAEIIAYATQWDPQPFHTDPAAAEHSFFAGLVASGWHTAALSMRLQVQSGPSIAGGLIGAGGELIWPLPTHPNDTLHVHSEITAITPSRSRPNRGIVAMRSETRNQHGGIVQIFNVKMVVPRK